VIVSRGGNQVFRATLDASGQLDILNAAKSRVDCRLQTGNLPSGVAMRADGTRAYANNEANFSVTSMDTANCLTQQLDISSSEPPAPGSVQHDADHHTPGHESGPGKKCEVGQARNRPDVTLDRIGQPGQPADRAYRGSHEHECRRHRRKERNPPT